MKQSAPERFDEKVRIATTGCWEWIAYRNPCGYGQFGVNGKLMLAHRFSWSHHKGEIPNKMCVLHRCDNPACVNPDHLFLGTMNDNMQDMIAKGRDRKATGDKSASRLHPETRCRGENKPAAKLKSVDIPVIRRMISEGMPHRAIASIFKVSKPQISYIKNGQTWSHIH